MSNQVLEDTLASLDNIQTGTSELLEVARGALAIPNQNDKMILRSLAELCTGLIEKICAVLPKEEATVMLCE